MKEGDKLSKRRANGDGMIRRLQSGTWEGRIVVGHKEDGSSIFRYVYAKTQKDLKTKLEKLKNEYKNADLTEDSTMLLSEWLMVWLEDEKINLRSSTYNSYMTYIKKHINPMLGDKVISSITHKDIVSLYNNLQNKGLSPTTVKRIHTTLHKALRIAAEKNMIPNNPTDGIKFPRINHTEMRVLNDEELDTFIKEIDKDTYWKDLFYLELATGLRLGEICGLRWEDYDGSKLSIRRTITKEKGKPYSTSEPKTEQSKRDIVLPYIATAILNNRKRETDWIFPYYLGVNEPMHPNCVYKALKKILKSANLPDIRFHDLRHTFATMALDGGMDIKTLSDMIGHATSSTTLNVYLHSTDKMKKEAANKIDSIFGNNRVITPKEEKKTSQAIFEPTKTKYRKQGTGCIHKINDKLYEGRISTKIDGKRKAKCVYGKTEKECEEKLKELIKETKSI